MTQSCRTVIQFSIAADMKKKKNQQSSKYSKQPTVYSIFSSLLYLLYKFIADLLLVCAVVWLLQAPYRMRLHLYERDFLVIIWRGCLQH
jgi:hypothetical protein